MRPKESATTRCPASCMAASRLSRASNRTLVSIFNRKLVAPADYTAAYAHRRQTGVQRLLACRPGSLVASTLHDWQLLVANHSPREVRPGKSTDAPPVAPTVLDNAIVGPY